MSDTRKKIIIILEELGFFTYIGKKQLRVVINHESFDKLQPQQFAAIFYFLFGKLSAETAKNKFRAVYPSREPKQEAEFRKISIAWLEDLIKKDSNCNIKSIPPVHFQRLFGEPFVELVLSFASYVLSRHVIRKFAKMNVNIESFIGPSKTSTDLLSKVIDLEARTLEYDSQVKIYREKVSIRRQQFAREREQVDQELLKLVNYKTADFLAKSNEKLENDLEELNEYIGSISRQLKADTNASLSKIEPRDKSLIEELEQVDQMTRFLKRNAVQLQQGLEHATKLKRTIDKQRLLLDQVPKKVEALKEDLGRVKGALFQTNAAKVAREKVMAYFKPILDTPLTFRAYNPGLRARIDAILKEAEAEKKEECMNGV